MRLRSLTVLLASLSLAACAMMATTKMSDAPPAPPIVTATTAPGTVPGYSPGRGPNTAAGGAAAGVDTAWMRFRSKTPRQIACGELPVLLEESHTSVRLTGNCGYVRVAGDHNDISIEVVPGGTIEATGAHNDIAWNETTPGPPPNLYNTGTSNTFHAPRK